jgi:hypothetical protein
VRIRKHRLRSEGARQCHENHSRKRQGSIGTLIANEETENGARILPGALHIDSRAPI